MRRGAKEGHPEIHRKNTDNNTDNGWGYDAIVEPGITSKYPLKQKLGLTRYKIPEPPGELTKSQNTT